MTIKENLEKTNVLPQQEYKETLTNPGNKAEEDILDCEVVDKDNIIEINAVDFETERQYQELLKPIKSSGVISLIFVVPLLLFAVLSISMPGILFVVLAAGSIVSVFRLFLQIVRAAIKLMVLMRREKEE